MTIAAGLSPHRTPGPSATPEGIAMHTDNANEINDTPMSPMAAIPHATTVRPIMSGDTSFMDSRMPFFENDDWLVDDFGIRAKMPTGAFNIPASRLGELTTSSPGAFLFWLTHMAHEHWIRIDLFAEAYKRALTIHRGRYGPQIPDALLNSSIRAATTISTDTIHPARD
jgi:hypothetical protein